MTFVSFAFWAFFPIVTTLYFLISERFRIPFLLLVSCIFYVAFIPLYILVLLALIIIDYSVALGMERAQGRRRKHLLLVSILSLVGVLFVFKYFNFVNANIALLASFLHWKYPIGLLTLALPLGLSFHTFQSLSYVIEVYRGKQKAERNFLVYALYVMFYPQLVAGPIERPQQLLYQFYERHVFDYERVKAGLIRMAWGFFKKMVVADRLAVVVNHVFAEPHSFNGTPLFIAAVFFTFEIYFDFSGYCDIAIGAAQVMGFTLMENFDRPFASRSINEFWRRWHISLSSWFRDYVYIPLGGNRVSKQRYILNILIVFFVSGLWHGANWTYVIWGSLHGVYIAIGSQTAPLRQRFAEVIRLAGHPWLRDTIQTCLTFLLVCVAFVFFRAVSISDAFYILSHMFTGLADMKTPMQFSSAIAVVGLSLKSMTFSLLLISCALWGEYLGRIKGVASVIVAQPLYIRWIVYWAIIAAIFALNESTTSQFIYFQF